MTTEEMARRWAKEEFPDDADHCDLWKFYMIRAEMAADLISGKRSSLPFPVPNFVLVEATK